MDNTQKFMLVAIITVVSVAIPLIVFVPSLDDDERKQRQVESYTNTDLIDCHTVHSLCPFVKLDSKLDDIIERLDRLEQKP